MKSTVFSTSIVALVVTNLLATPLNIHKRGKCSQDSKPTPEPVVDQPLEESQSPIQNTDTVNNETITPEQQQPELVVDTTTSDAGETSPTTPPAGYGDQCGWPGHCLGDSCETFNDCFGDMICNGQNQCGPVEGGTPQLKSQPASTANTPSTGGNGGTTTSPRGDPSTCKVLESGLSGSTTHFDDDNYQCYEWNNKAKSAIEAGFKFAAANFKLAAPSGAPFELKCGGPKYLCARANNEEYIIIDWCDPNGAEQCTETEKGHLDILVLQESNNVDCVNGCGAYNSFVQAPAWDLVECSFDISPDEFGVSSLQGDASEYGKKRKRSFF